jgi:hypothetical protein
MLCLVKKLHINYYYTNGKHGVYDWIGHILRRNCLLKRDTMGTIKGRAEVTERRGRRRKQVLYNLKEREDAKN